MSAFADRPPQGSPALRLHRQLAAIWGTGPGWQRLAAVNHSIIGLRYRVATTALLPRSPLTSCR
jgi:cytochrome c oxidase subunit I+III